MNIVFSQRFFLWTVEVEAPKSFMHNAFFSNSTYTFFPQVEILLHIVSDYSDEDRFNQRAGIFLLNQLACQVQIGLQLVRSLL